MIRIDFGVFLCLVFSFEQIKGDTLVRDVADREHAKDEAAWRRERVRVHLRLGRHDDWVMTEQKTKEEERTVPLDCEVLIGRLEEAEVGGKAKLHVKSGSTCYLKVYIANGYAMLLSGRGSR